MHYVSSNGKLTPGYNMLEIQIHGDDDAEEPVGFGIEVTKEKGDTIQTSIILQPLDERSIAE